MRRRGAQSGHTPASTGLGPLCTATCPQPPVHPRTGHGPPRSAGPGDPRAGRPGLGVAEWDNGWPVLQFTRFLRSLPRADCGATVESHLYSCQRAGKAGGWLSAPPRGGPRSLPDRCPLLHAAEMAPRRALAASGLRGQTVPLCGGPVDIFGDHAVSGKKSGFGERHLGTQSSFCQVLTQARIPHDREVDIAGNGRRPADVLLRAWDGRLDLAVDLTIVHPSPATGRPLR